MSSRGFKEWQKEERLSAKWGTRGIDERASLAGYAAGAESMRNRCVTTTILELKGEPQCTSLAYTLAALPLSPSSEEAGVSARGFEEWLAEEEGGRITAPGDKCVFDAGYAAGAEDLEKLRQLVRTWAKGVGHPLKVYSDPCLALLAYIRDIDLTAKEESHD